MVWNADKSLQCVQRMLVTNLWFGLQEPYFAVYSVLCPTVQHINFDRATPYTCAAGRQASPLPKFETFTGRGDGAGTR